MAIENCTHPSPDIQQCPGCFFNICRETKSQGLGPTYVVKGRWEGEDDSCHIITCTYSSQNPSQAPNS